MPSLKNPRYYYSSQKIHLFDYFVAYLVAFTLRANSKGIVHYWVSYYVSNQCLTLLSTIEICWNFGYLSSLDESLQLDNHSFLAFEEFEVPNISLNFHCR